MDPIHDSVRQLPKEPGVYLLRGEGSEVLYVGKAKNLHARVATYFQAAGDTRWRMETLRRSIRDVEVIVTDTEKEALILEHTLIQRHLPPFNVRLKDDKSYLSLRVDPREEWPRVRLVRRWRRDGALYFGPFASAAGVRRTMRWIRRFFGIRSCTDTVFRGRERPCLYYQIRECTGPCVGLISREEYQARVRDVIQFLRGNGEDLLRRLRAEMVRESDALRFERAAVLRDQVRSIEAMFEPQKVTVSKGGDRDVLAFHREGEIFQVVVQFVRDGRLVHSRRFPFRTMLEDAEVVSDFLLQFYGGGRLVPEEILVPTELPDREVLEEWLAERRGGRVRLHRPHRGPKAGAVAMAAKTAAVGFQDSVRALEERERALERLARVVGLPAPPRIMECYDVSNLQGAAASGSLVTFEDGYPAKSRYRRFRIRRCGGPDDPGMMREMLRRRFARALREGQTLPHLVILDGGVGQLTAARETLDELGLTGVAAVALAKGRSRNVGGVSSPGLGERIFVGTPPREVVLEEGTPERRILDHIRDEAHRFALRYHRQLRGRQWLESPLEDLFGLGPKRRRTLLQAFESLEGVRNATVQELSAVPGIPRGLAVQIHAFFRKEATLAPDDDGDA